MPRVFRGGLLCWWVEEMEQTGSLRNGPQEKWGEKIFGELLKPKEDIMGVDFLVYGRENVR